MAKSGTAVQCSACEHSFTAFGEAESPGEEAGEVSEHEASAAESPPSPSPPPREEPRSSSPVPPVVESPPVPPAGPKPDGRLFLSQGERVYKVKDLPTLQRWIVEKRVLPSDRISEDGTNWEIVSQRDDLRPFFAVIEQIKSAKRQLRQREREVREVAQRAVQALASSSSEDLISSLDNLSVKELASGALDEEFSSTPVPGEKSSGVIREATAAMAALDASSASVESISPGQMTSRDPIHDPSGDEPAGAEELDNRSSSSGSPAPSWSGSGNVVETRSLPALSESEVEESGESAQEEKSLEEEGDGAESGFWSQTSWGDDPAASVAAASAISVSPASEEAVSDDFDPDQVFEGYKGGSSSRFYVGLFAAVALGAAGLWYFILGPGKPVPEEVVVDSSSAAVERAVATDKPALSVEPAPPSDVGGTPTDEGSEVDKVTAPPASVAVRQPDTVVKQGAAPAKKVEIVKSPPEPKPKPKPEPKPKPKPERVVDHFALGEAQFDEGNFSRAVEFYQRALKQDPRNFKASKQLGWAHIEVGQAAAARAAFAKAIGIRRSSSEAHYGLGLAYEELGNSAKAKAEYEAALSLAPNGPDAPELRALISKME